MITSTKIRKPRKSNINVTNYDLFMSVLRSKCDLYLLLAFPFGMKLDSQVSNHWNSIIIAVHILHISKLFYKEIKIHLLPQYLFFEELNIRA